MKIVLGGASCLALIIVGVLTIPHEVTSSHRSTIEVAGQHFTTDPPWRVTPTEASRSGPFPTEATTTTTTTTLPPAPPTTPAALTRPVPKPTVARAAPVVVSTAVQAPMVTAPAGSKWACIIQRESGGNPRAVNPSSGAGGLFQFLPSSWIAYGGTGRPQDASVAEQWRIALAAYARSGWSPWAGGNYRC